MGLSQPLFEFWIGFTGLVLLILNGCMVWLTLKQQAKRLAALEANRRQRSRRSGPRVEARWVDFDLPWAEPEKTR